MEGEYYHTPESVAQYIELAKDVNGQFLIDELQKILPKGAHVLELGDQARNLERKWKKY